MTLDEAERILDLLDRSGDKALVSFDLDGQTRKLPNPLTVEEARTSIRVAVDLGAVRISITRHES